MNIRAPKSKYSNFYEIARYNLTWNFSILMLIFLSILTVILFIADNYATMVFLGGALLSGTSIVLLLKTKAYYYSAVVYSIVGIFLCIYALNFNHQSIHLANPLWMALISFYTFFTLGKKWGVFIIFVALVSLIYFVLFNYNTNLSAIRNQDKDLISLAINILICVTLIALLTLRFITLNAIAENKSQALTQTLSEKNDEKTILLKEVHHRVKNNLQVIISLMRLKSFKSDSEDNHSDTIDRIRAMSLIHQKIYQSDDLARIDLNIYLNDLISDLVESHAVDKTIDYEISSNVEALKMKSLVPLALIFNELISNSIKHAFSVKKSGNISITVDATPTEILMTYHDNGKWIDSKKTNTLGIELIDSLTTQLLGEYTLDTSEGTKYTFVFKREH